MATDKDWEKAGNIAQQSLLFGKKLVKPGVTLLSVAHQIEEKIKQLGGHPAFPVNISLDSGAAHFSPKFNDPQTFAGTEVVKLDVGVSVNGAIGDNALTIDLSGNNAKLVKASMDAVAAVEKILKAGVTIGEIGHAIESIIQDAGFIPIKNLSGHSLEPYELHAGITIPNIDTGDDRYLEAGTYLAVEPFATTGLGEVLEASHPQIFCLEKTAKARTPFARNIIQHCQQYNGLPFAKRWLPQLGLELGLKEILNNNSCIFYRPLVEKAGGLVSQHEHTFLIKDKKAIRLTSE